MCQRTDTSSVWMCVTNRGGAAGDWVSMGGGGDPYELPVASDTVLGGVKVGTGLSIDGGGVLSADAANPMTAAGDIIIGGTSGAGIRLAAGTDGQVLKLVGGSPLWQNESGGGGGGGGSITPVTWASSISIALGADRPMFYTTVAGSALTISLTGLTAGYTATLLVTNPSGSGISLPVTVTSAAPLNSRPLLINPGSAAVFTFYANGLGVFYDFLASTGDMFRYIRFDCASGGGDPWYAPHGFVEYGDALAWKALPMTSNTAPSPLVASNSSFLDVGTEAWRAFALIGEGWTPGFDSNPSWIQIDLGADASNWMLPTRLRYTVKGASDRYPRTFTVSGSATGEFSGEQTLLANFSSLGESTSLWVQALVLVPVTFLASIFAQIGDLVASKLKRTYGIKDFGTILPGHGGLLDRFDSILFVAMFLTAIFILIHYFYPAVIV